VSHGFVAPAYHARSLVDVLPAVGAALGADLGADLRPGPSSLSLPDAASYVVFLVDGLGYELLRAHPDDAPYLTSVLAGQDDTRPATAAVPSTTATSLTSLGTGLPPGSHGVVGFTSRIPGTDKLLNALQWTDRVDPVQWQPNPTVFSRLEAAGVHTTQVNKREFAQSGLTVASSRGGGYTGADRPGERLAAVCRSSGRQPSVTYLYDGDLDWTGHRYGVDSAQWRAQLSVVDVSVELLRESLPDRTRLVVVADHGMVDCPAARRVDVADHPALREGVALVGGEARFRHVYCHAGQVADVATRWRDVLGDRAEVLDREEAVARGWFGDLLGVVRPRVGDVLVAARGDLAVLDTASFPYESTLVGMHGSLTPAEMLVPLLVL
jgi:hypothetical protein